MRRKVTTKTRVFETAVFLSAMATFVPAAQPPQVEWAKTFGGAEFDAAGSVQQTSDGGYIIVGMTASSGAGAFDVYLVKTDTGGNRQWEMTFGGTNTSAGESIQQTLDGGYVVAGYGDSTEPSFQVYLIKLAAEGSFLRATHWQFYR